MKPAPFGYRRPATVGEALDLLGADDVTLIAGGQSLLPLLNLRMARPSTLVDIGRLVELDRIVDLNDSLAIGALTRHSRLETDPVVAGSVPLLAAAAAHIGHRAIRNHGTIGGSIAHADPAAELPAVLLALGGSVDVESTNGRRRIAADHLFRGHFETAVEPHELVTWVNVPVVAGRRTGFCEYAPRAGDFAHAGAVAVVDSPTLRLVVFAVGSRPVILTEGPLDASTPAALVTAVDTLDLPADRAALVRAVARRAIDQAAGKRTVLTTGGRRTGAPT